MSAETLIKLAEKSPLLLLIVVIWIQLDQLQSKIDELNSGISALRIEIAERERRPTQWHVE